MIGCLLLYAGPALSASAFSLDYQGASFDVYRLDGGEEQALSFFWKKPDGTAYLSIHALRQSLEERGRELVFATNGGIYSEQFTPLGLYIENGRRYYKLNRIEGGGNFFLLPNGVFYITKRGARIVQTEDYNPRDEVINALQSGPMLVIEDQIHPRFIAGFHSKYVRSGVGVDRQGRVVFAISNEPVNFYDFAKFFKEKLDSPNALYLDGRISEMYAPELFRFGGWPWHQFTTLIAISTAAPEAAEGSTE